MLITFDCPACASRLELDAEEAGTRVVCPACAAEVRAPLPRVAPGTTLGNFRLEEKIGSGGMGEVFLALQLSMDRRVALKVLPQALTRKPGVVERFNHEVRMSARLEHPHIVTAFEAGEDAGHHFLAVSYVEGEDLRHRLKREGALGEKEALTHTRQIADALAYAWNAFRMLHRDVKPANIMVDRKGNARLMDFGISKSLIEGEQDGDLTVSGMLVGTPHYISPEQAHARDDLDCRADIYSLGATLYHLLTGQTPYLGKTTIEVLRQIGTVPVLPVRELNSAVSENAARLVAKMMAPDRESRHPRWESVLVDIDRVLNGREPLLVLPGAPGGSSPPAAAKAPAAGAAGSPPPAPRREPPVAATGAAARGSPGSTTEMRREPPRIDLRRRRSAWLTRRLILWLIALAAFAAAAWAVRDLLRHLDESSDVLDGAAERVRVMRRGRDAGGE